jgi:hypothetical protein
VLAEMALEELLSSVDEEDCELDELELLELLTELDDESVGATGGVTWAEELELVAVCCTGTITGITSVRKRVV